MLDQFILEDELEPGCMKDIPILDIPCGAVFPKPDIYRGLLIYNLDPIFCDECSITDQAKLYQKVYPEGVK